MFNYGSFKLLLLKVFVGIFLFGFSLFLFVSIYTYNPNDPGIGKLATSSEITNYFGFWGAFFSSVLITLYGKASFFLYLGVFMFLGLTLKKPLLKILLIILSVTLFNIVLLSFCFFKSEIFWEEV